MISIKSVGKGGRGNFVSGAMSYYARKKDFAWGFGVSGELRVTSTLPILGGRRMALGCSGLHANGCFNACRNCPAP